MEERKKMEVKDRERARAMTLCGDSKFPGSHVWGGLIPCLTEEPFVSRLSVYTPPSSDPSQRSKMRRPNQRPSMV